MSKSIPTIPGALSVHKGPGGLTMLHVQGAGGSAEIALLGSHVTAFTPQGQEPVLWSSAHSMYEVGKPIRGGIPICWPWFGPAAEEQRPAHGVARLVEWEVEEAATLSDGRVRVCLRLPISGNHRQWVPAGLNLRSSITVGSSLEVALETRNDGPEPLRFADALHSYFAVNDIHHSSVEGLDGCVYWDKCAGGVARVQDGPVHFTAETDRVYADRGARTRLLDGQRCICIDKWGSASTVVWNPWTAKAAAMADFGDDEWPGMACVETANCLHDPVLLLPGSIHRTQLRISLCSPTA